jgi:uroporphyrinogen decarboxylase
MNGKQRVLAALRMETCDRVPVFPCAHYFSAGVAGMSVRTFSTDGDKMATALLCAAERFGWDGINPGSDVAVEGEALGSTAGYPDDGPPHVTQPGLVEPSDLAVHTVPNPLHSGRMPVIIRATEICAQEAGGEIYIMPVIMGPLNCASQFRGVDQVLMDTLERPDFFDELLNFCGEVVAEYGKALIDAGAHGLLMGEALCSPGMISPALYRSIVPRQRRLVETLKSHGAQHVLLHICGDVKRILPAMVETTADIFDLDWQVNLAEAKCICSPAGVTMRGNVDPAEVLLRGTPEVVYRRSVEAIRAAGDTGFILGSGCDVAPGTAYENLRAMSAAARDLSRSAAAPA